MRDGPWCLVAFDGPSCLPSCDLSSTLEKTEAEEEDDVKSEVTIAQHESSAEDSMARTVSERDEDGLDVRA